MRIWQVNVLLLFFRPTQVVYDEASQKLCGCAHLTVITLRAHYKPQMCGLSSASDDLFASHNDHVSIFDIKLTLSDGLNDLLHVTNLFRWGKSAPTQLSLTCARQIIKSPFSRTHTVQGEYNVSQYYKLNVYIKA